MNSSIFSAGGAATGIAQHFGDDSEDATLASVGAWLLPCVNLAGTLATFLDGLVLLPFLEHGL